MHRLKAALAAVLISIIALATSCVPTPAAQAAHNPLACGVNPALFGRAASTNPGDRTQTISTAEAANWANNYANVKAHSVDGERVIDAAAYFRAKRGVTAQQWRIQWDSVILPGMPCYRGRDTFEIQRWDVLVYKVRSHGRWVVTGKQMPGTYKWEVTPHDHLGFDWPL